MSSDLHMLFVAHGSPAPGYGDGVNQFARAWLQLHAGATAEVAYLESEPPRFCDSLKRSPATVVAPLFLHEGVHTQQDISDAIASSGKKVNLLPALISEPFLIEALLGRLDESGYEGGAVVLYSHGSRDETTLPLISSLAQKIGRQRQCESTIAVAYGEPGLQDVLGRLLTAGEKQVTVVPHFLFSGLWQKKLQQRIEEAVAAHYMDIRVASPLGDHPAMLAMIDSFVAEVEVNHD